MSVRHLTGHRLRQAIVAASRALTGSREELNAINVFPVADADTGTNMDLTLKSIVTGSLECTGLDLSAMSAKVAELAIMGSRGNSGAILAQFFQGMAEKFSGAARADAPSFAAAMSYASESAANAVSQPVKGTILTVMQAWAAKLQSLAASSPDLIELVERSLAAAQDALENTTRQLDVLAAAAVVDSGAQGFVIMLAGAVEFAKSGRDGWSPPAAATTHPLVVHDPGAITFRFCTECVIEGADLDHGEIRHAASAMGDSLIVLGSPARVRVHIHTDAPEQVYAALSAYGQVSNQKAEDMRQQHDEHFSAHPPDRARDYALIVDSSCDLSAAFIEKHGVQVVPVSVTIGSQTYLDRVTLTRDTVYALMREADRLPTTSQPPPGAFVQAFESAAPEKGALIFTMSSAASGSYQSALTAARSQPDSAIEVIDSRTTGGAMGLLVGVAAAALESHCELDEIRERLLAARPHAKLFLTVTTMDNLIHSGRVGKVRGRIARLLNLVPILTMSPEGKPVKVGQARAGRPSWQKLLDRVIAESENYTNISFAVSHANHPASAAFFENGLRRHFELEHVDVFHSSPAFAALVGPGSSGISMLGDALGTRAKKTDS